MARNLQHIADAGDMAKAGSAGEKVASLCGKLVYSMPDMEESIPTCTRCARILMAQHNELVVHRPQWTTFVWTSPGTSTWAA